MKNGAGRGGAESKDRIEGESDMTLSWNKAAFDRNMIGVDEEPFYGASPSQNMRAFLHSSALVGRLSSYCTVLVVFPNQFHIPSSSSSLPREKLRIIYILHVHLHLDPSIDASISIDSPIAHVEITSYSISTNR